MRVDSARIGQVQGRISNNWAVIPGEPIDFSFKDIASVAGISYWQDITSEDAKGGVIEKKKGEITTAILLSNNKFSTVGDLSRAVIPLQLNAEVISWIDLSFNLLPHIEEVLELI